MKKLSLVVFILIFCQMTAFSQSCLPEGIYFSTQAQIDSFQYNYPNCTELEGDVTINVSNITNLNGLSVVTSIGGDLMIEYNTVLPSLTGLDNIDAESIVDLYIFSNNILSTCESQSICDYLASPNGTIEIYANATGCDSQDEVEAACGVGLTENITPGYCSVYPNPFTGETNLSIQLKKPAKIKLMVFNNLGQVVETILDESLSQGKHQVTWNAERLPAGIYFYRFSAAGNRQPAIGKLVVAK